MDAHKALSLRLHGPAGNEVICPKCTYWAGSQNQLCPDSVLLLFENKTHPNVSLMVFSPKSEDMVKNSILAWYVQPFFRQWASMNTKQSQSSGGKRVLVVDSDQEFRRYVTDCLEAEGISCIGATCVSEALEALARNDISVLLVDWFLDRVASEVVRTARSKSALMPIIVMSGKSYNVKMDALLADADEFLEKTLGGSVLANRVKRWMSRLDAAPDVFLPRREEDVLLLDEVKYRYIRHVVELVGNNISLAAQKLGVHRQTIAAAMATEEVGENNNGHELVKLSATRGGSDSNDHKQ